MRGKVVLSVRLEAARGKDWTPAFAGNTLVLITTPALPIIRVHNAMACNESPTRRIIVNTRTLMTSALTLLGAVSSAQALSAEQPWYIVPFASYIQPDHDRHADGDVGAGVGVGKVLGEHWNLELEGVYDSLDLNDVSGKFKHQGASFDGLYFLNRNPVLAPYGVLSVGSLRHQYQANKHSDVFYEAGVGAVHQFSESSLQLRGDLRYRVDRDDESIEGQSQFNDWVLNVGLVIPFGESAPKRAAAAPVAVAAPVVAAAAPMDSDGDGVTDDKDRCPNTPKGAKVNAEGCELDADGDGVVDSKDRCPNTPAGAKVNADGCELDSDGDGVVDSQDRCPNTPAGTKVNAQGCPLDSDGDGVLDADDKCPDTVKGAKVDAQGCVVTLILKGVNFEVNSAKLNADSMAALDVVADSLLKNPDAKLEVGGHTDNKGSAAYNKKLSAARAKSVMDYLVLKGVPAARLTAKGYGLEKPIADNKTADGRALNRRVELQKI